MSKRHPFHSICPYFAMFPEQFVEKQLLSFTSLGDLVFDPFCGRGTTVFESLLKGRRAVGSDVNPVAVCVSSAKAAAPKFNDIATRIDTLEEKFRSDEEDRDTPTSFFEVCFERKTLGEILFLRDSLNWRYNAVDCFIAAVMLGILHGDPSRSSYCLSNRMPRTISTKPDYSVRWWNQRSLRPPRRPVFDTLRRATAFRYRLPPADTKGVVRLTDAREAASKFCEFAGQVQLVVTSPPYLNTTDYAEDQWLRLWFLGGKPRPEFRRNRDDRLTRTEDYWAFLEGSWSGIASLLADDATIVIRIGGSKLSKIELFTMLTFTLRTAFNVHNVDPLHEGLTSSIRPRETAAFRSAPPRPRVEHDFVYRLSKRRGQFPDDKCSNTIGKVRRVAL